MAGFATLLGPLALATASFAVFLLLHVLVWRSSARHGLSYGLLFALLLAGALAGIALWALASSTPWWLHAPPATALYLLLAMLYLHLYSGLARSLSVRILGELSRSQDAALSLDDLDAVYSQRDLLDRRLQALVGTGWIVEASGRYRNTARGARWARVLQLLARLYRRDVTG